MFFKVIVAAFVVALNGFGWYAIFGNVNGFINSRMRRPVAVEQVVKRKVATVTTDALNMREKPSENEALIMTLHKGDRLIVNAEPQDGWVPVEIDGKSGFVSDSFILIEEE
jgi:uncharacterized protein YgiM (DUF1202 family)